MRAVNIYGHRGKKMNELLGNISRILQWTMYTRRLFTQAVLHKPQIWLLNIFNYF